MLCRGRIELRYIACWRDRERYRTCVYVSLGLLFFFFSSRRRHTRSDRDWSSDVCSSDLESPGGLFAAGILRLPLTSASSVATSEFKEPITLSSRSWMVGSQRMSPPVDRKSVV